MYTKVYTLNTVQTIKKKQLYRRKEVILNRLRMGHTKFTLGLPTPYGNDKSTIATQTTPSSTWSFTA